MPATPEQLAKARRLKEALKDAQEAAEHTKVCAHGHDCKVTLYVKAEAWCKHGRMKDEGSVEGEAATNI